jgi:hypothetical protein
MGACYNVGMTKKLVNKITLTDEQLKFARRAYASDFFLTVHLARFVNLLREKTDKI